MKVTFPQCSHITRKRGIYHYRRRLPSPIKGEICLTLSTKGYREAEHRVALLDAAFKAAWARALKEAQMTRQDTGTILRTYLRESLDQDLKRRLERTPGSAVYAHWWDSEDGTTASEADLQAIRSARASLVRDLEANSPKEMMEEAEAIAIRYGLPSEVIPRLATGLIEAAIRKWDVAERRTLGLEPLVFEEETPVRRPVGSDVDSVAVAMPPKPMAIPPSDRPLISALIEPFFGRREHLDRTTHQVMGQERGTLRRFIEAAGDRPAGDYGRGDITKFLDVLRRLPNTYGRSPKDKDRPLADIIAEADAKSSPRLTDKTVKRHLAALSQFFQFAVDRGQLSVAGRTELVQRHRFKETARAKDQRDVWQPNDLVRLFSSPIWTGSDPEVRSRPGPHIIRDAKFWLPLLGLFHGARLEEFADLYRRDVGEHENIWFVRIAETEERRLKTSNAERVLPLHPELVRIGFLDYVHRIAPQPDDPLFPDLVPQGKDRRRGPRFTRFFVNYRRAIGVYRQGIAMHSFRHTANTRLRGLIQDYQQERLVTHLLGHGQGGNEGRLRYDKGPDLEPLAAALGLLRYDELDLSHLYEQPSVLTSEV